MKTIEVISMTQGINHLGLSVKDLNQTRDFFVNGLGWEESGRDESYPRTAVSDGHIKFTLWQVDHNLEVQDFHRRKNIGLHHVALTVASEQELNTVFETLKNYPGIEIEFSPELVSGGPRKHFICYEPGGIRVEFIWSGQ